ncbi:MAG: hypothetical protein D6798_01140 [Deltaproteobacteria bacterium]|nr:MAG: hypothetical protein D6798_01140 [Deltaproteobacteria bacterium]
MPDRFPESPDRPPRLDAPLARLRPRTAAVTAGAAVTTALLAVWALLAITARARLQDQHQLLAEQTALRIQDWVSSRLLVLRSIATLRGQGMLVTPESWRRRIAADMQTIGGYQAINWIDDDGIIAITAPAAGNEGALGRNVRDHPVAGPVFARAEATRTLQVSPPLDLFQGGRAFTTYLPVTTPEGETAGYVNGVFRVDRLVDHALNRIDPATLVVTIHDGDDVVWSPAVGERRGGEPAIASLSIGDRTWVLRLHPTRPAISPLVHLLVVAGALAAGGTAGLAAATATREAREAAEARAETARVARHVEELERLEALGRVAGGIAHDFNNILSIVVGRASMLELQCQDHPQARADIDAILDAGERGAELVDSLLTFSRRKDQAGGRVDAARHLAQMEPLLRHVAGRGVRFSLQVEADVAWVPLDPTALDRVVINLVSNARQAFDGAGGHIEVRLAADGAGFALSVIDDGRGMSPEVRTRVFEPFFTTREDGTGLGLATVFGLVTEAGGRFDIDSEPGRGTRFTVHLPAAGSQRAATPSA